MVDILVEGIISEIQKTHINLEDWGIETRNDLIEFALEFLLANIESAFEE